MPPSWLPSALLTLALSFAVRAQNDTDTDTGGDNDDANVDSNPWANSLAPSDCHCGFLDPLTGAAYTDSLLVYFNESQGVTDDFNVSNFEHRYEKGWQMFYREGAAESNIYWQDGGDNWSFGPGGQLIMNVSGASPEHLVDGSEIITKRQDMLHGSFRVKMRSSQPYDSGGGSAMSMRLWHNESISAELDLLNMDDSGPMARLAMTTNMQDPLPENCINYTTLDDDWDQSPYNFWEYRIDWGEESMEWYADIHKIRTMQASNWTVPMSLSVKHWSTGNQNWMQGPPVNSSAAGVAWIRSFFNSSLSNSFPHDCSPDQYCSTEDTTLRTVTSYPVEAVTPSEELVEKKKYSPSTAAIALAIASVVLTSVLFIFGITKKASTKKQAPVRPAMKAHQSDVELNQIKPGRHTARSSRTITDDRSYNSRPTAYQRSVSERPLLGKYDSYVGSSVNLSEATVPYGGPGASQRASQRFSYNNGYATPEYNASIVETTGESAYSGFAATPQSGFRQREASLSKDHVAAASSVGVAVADAYYTTQREPGVSVAGSAVATEDLAGLAGANPGGHDAVKAAEPAPPAAKAAAPAPRMRVDYLAGLVALCSILVSMTHFILTYVPSVIMEYLPRHYRSEYWARGTIEPFFFNEIWVGIFFTTSTRFLTTAYLRKGDLKIIAEKVVCRCPRLMIPIASVILFEYFLMDVGATTYLEYIPSITWSTWPSTRVYNNFGWFINETLQLVYLIPNAAPQLTWNFCTGVLWTIPVQLQNSWLVLLGVVIIKEIKTPWKRFGYYTFCILNHWYALSWGSYFWFGLLLADLDITYKYRTAIQRKALLLYPLLTLASILVFCSLGNDLLSFWSGWTFSTAERDIHPEPLTALNIGATDESGYPEYTEPKLNGLVFCVAAQFIVEISVWTQKFLSTKPFLLLFPHVFTIYLIHGLVQWSMGSLVCVYFAGQGLPYWLNILLTCVISYATLFAALPVVTPVMEMLGKEMTKSIWVAASEEPVEWKPTCWPLEREEVGVLKGRSVGVS